MEILLNKMYVGSYLMGDNIGHEIINLFRDDNDRNYIYINPYGMMGKEHDNQVETILLVRLINEGNLEVLAKVQGLKQIAFHSKDKTKLHEEQIRYIRENSITYGGVLLDKIFEGNTYKGEADTDTRYVTFEAKQLFKVKTSVYITENEDDADEANHVYYLDLGNDHFGKQNHTRFISDGKYIKAYTKLKEIIGNNGLWEALNTTEKIKKDAHPYSQIDSFITLIRKQYDELAYSNMFGHFFAGNEDRFRKFSQEVLGKKLHGRYSVKREYKNIDILIEDKDNIIVIENKIKSGINGIKHDVYGDLIQTQLDKYYETVSKPDFANGKQISCFIFVPNYNQIDESRFKCREYRVVTYKQLYDFFSKEEYQSDPEKYYQEFLNALYIHSRLVDNFNFEIMQDKFYEAIKYAGEE